MSMLELPDKQFMQLYLRVIELRFPTSQERRRYENCMKYRDRITPEEFAEIKRRIDKYDNTVRINRKKAKRLRDDNKVDWEGIEDAILMKKETFNVRLLVDDVEQVWPVTAFSYKAAKQMAIDAAIGDGKATTVKVL